MEAGQTQLSLEQLDGRILPGSLTFRVFTGPTTGTKESTPIAYSPPTYHGYRVLANHPLLVQGSASGSFAKTDGTNSTSASYSLSGTIQLYGFGSLNLSGTIVAPGASQSQASGDLILTTHEGQITLNLTGPSHSSNGAIPGQFAFTVTSATGEYLHAGGEGIVSVSLSQTSGNSGHISLSLT